MKQIITPTGIFFDNESKRFEKINTSVYENAALGSEYVARQIAELIRDKAARNEYAVLGLATGSSPIGVYQNLVRMHQEEGLSFRNVITFNLDEYYPMAPDAQQSYVRFMHTHLFDHIDIDPDNVHIPDGTLAPEDIKAFCLAYEAQIEESGGIDLQLLGIGRTGHIGFNEPGSSLQSKTRLVRLDRLTRLDAASDFFGVEGVPYRAITMGVGTIMAARKIILLAWGEAKADIIRQTVEGPIQESVPATFLQEHSNCEFVLDEAAAAELTRIKTPWLVMEPEWHDKLIKKAVIWLSGQVNKVILQLTDEDYNEHGMGELVAAHGPAEEINLRVFNQLQHTITGWPGGKPNTDDSTRPERARPFPKTALIFSPHPDDDVISMGGTLIRLVDQGHQVHVAYQTSGNIAVFDHEVLRYIDFTRQTLEQLGGDKEQDRQLQEMQKQILNKKPGEADPPAIRQLKTFIRQGEARSACRVCQVPQANIHFMNLPFYETGGIKKNPLGEDDIEQTMALIKDIKPQQIFAAGDLSDPHGTHRICLSAIFEALKRLQKTEKWLADTYVWLYRGAWQEWSIADIEMAVPIGPKDMLRKRMAIFKHQSQKDVAMFPGTDKREFWERAEDRNHATARAYDALGLAQYEAIEAFVRWRF
ncbi:MAG TPA: glucosamine-6-phosphate deaminase [Flammeovirgaceae bacterium]|nr:glucosamine-6-phosphate deaminase [Flammeovirgaceae bacterium]